MSCSHETYQTGKVLVTFLLSIGVVFCFVQPCRAFDAERNGFVLGFSGGPAYAARTDVRESAPPEYRRRELGEGGLQTNLVIGHCFSQKFMVYYSGLQFWGTSLFRSGSQNGVGFVLLPSVAGRYYLSECGRSVFFGGGIGFSVVDDLRSSELGFSSGTAFHLLIGYELGKHFNVEVVAVYTDPSPRLDDQVGIIALTVGFLAY